MRIVILLSIIVKTFCYSSGYHLNHFKQSLTALNVRSKSVPFLEQPVALTGEMPGDVGFDPLNLSSFQADVRLPSCCFPPIILVDKLLLYIQHT